MQALLSGRRTGSEWDEDMPRLETKVQPKTKSSPEAYRLNYLGYCPTKEEMECDMASFLSPYGSQRNNNEDESYAESLANEAASKAPVRRRRTQAYPPIKLFPSPV